jgi:nicotinate-nucleotide adenylyltransferase
MRIGIFGGSFDPVHNGHIALARASQAQAALDEVWFTPAAVQPLKQAGPHASDSDRLEMLRLAIAGEPKWRVCSLEIERGGRSYTVDTLRAIHAQRPTDELYFLMGADALVDVPHWKEPAEIFRLAVPLVARRAGKMTPNLTALAAFHTVTNPPRLIDLPPVDASSSEIRRSVTAGLALNDWVPLPVAEYIHSKSIYSSAKRKP